MIVRNLLLKVAFVGVLIAGGLSMGCGDEAPAPDPGTEVDPGGEVAADPGQELTAAEQQAIQASFAAEAAAEINASNAAAAAAELEKEIEADLASE
jgi:hypothetical protein